MFSNGDVESMDPERTPDVLISKEENPRVQQLARRSSSASTKTGNRCPNSAASASAISLFEAIIDQFYIDQTLVAYGEEGGWGGAFARLSRTHRKRCRITACSIPPSVKAPLSAPQLSAVEGGRVIAN